MSVSVNGPKTPVTKGSNGIATATLPNICKMPGPPAPFVPAPLPNIGKTGDNPKDYSKKVKIEDNTVAIQGASFGSMGDMASKGTGGGMLSSNTHGPCKFISPGSMDVKIEGKNVQLLTDMVTNNGGPSGSPANAATMMGAIQLTGVVYIVRETNCPICGNEHENFEEAPQTKIDAMTLLNNYKETGAYHGTMIGVVHCKKGHKHAGRTNNDHRFVQVAQNDYHLAPQSSQQSTINQMSTVTDNSSAFQSALQLAHNEMLIKEAMPRDWGEAQISRNPPGACAAQKALVSALLHGCTPTAMTEKWFAPGKLGKTKYKQSDLTAGPVRHRNLEGELTARRFVNGESVPPCETCNLLIPFLTCQDKEPTCVVPVGDCPKC